MNELDRVEKLVSAMHRNLYRLGKLLLQNRKMIKDLDLTVDKLIKKLMEEEESGEIEPENPECQYYR